MAKRASVKLARNVEGGGGVQTDTEGGVRFGVGCGQQSVEEPLGGCGPLGLVLTGTIGPVRLKVDPYDRTVRGTQLDPLRSDRQGRLDADPCGRCNGASLGCCHDYATLTGPRPQLVGAAGVVDAGHRDFESWRQSTVDGGGDHGSTSHATLSDHEPFDEDLALRKHGPCTSNGHTGGTMCERLQGPSTGRLKAVGARRREGQLSVLHPVRTNTKGLQRPLVADQDLFRLSLFDQVQHDHHGGRR